MIKGKEEKSKKKKKGLRRKKNTYSILEMDECS